MPRLREVESAMHAAGRNRRQEERVAKALPMDLGTSVGVTRNVSASGMYFEAEMPCLIGNEIRFAVDLEMPGESGC